MCVGGCVVGLVYIGVCVGVYVCGCVGVLMGVCVCVR